MPIMVYSLQKVFCSVCGREGKQSVDDPFWFTRTCSQQCHDESCWRETLSVMGKEYYPKKERLPIEVKID